MEYESIEIIAGFVIGVPLIGGFIWWIFFESNKSKMQKKIYSIIAASNIMSIEKIASICQTDYLKVENEIRKMIDNADDDGFEKMKNAFIDYERKEIILATPPEK